MPFAPVTRALSALREIYHEDKKDFVPLLPSVYEPFYELPMGTPAEIHSLTGNMLHEITQAQDFDGFVSAVKQALAHANRWNSRFVNMDISPTELGEARQEWKHFILVTAIAAAQAAGVEPETFEKRLNNGAEFQAALETYHDLSFKNGKPLAELLQEYAATRETVTGEQSGQWKSFQTEEALLHRTFCRVSTEADKDVGFRNGHLTRSYDFSDETNRKRAWVESFSNIAAKAENLSELADVIRYIELSPKNKNKSALTRFEIDGFKSAFATLCTEQFGIQPPNLETVTAEQAEESFQRLTARVPKATLQKIFNAAKGNTAGAFEARMAGY